jgi:hypothetical protein
MIYLFILFFRLVLWSMGALIALSVLALWAFCWLVVFVVSFIYVAFDETRKAKRLARPATTRRPDNRREVDAFGHPIPPSRYSSRR